VKHRFATAMLGNKSRYFGPIGAKFRKITGKSAADGASEPDKIDELFASKYQTFYSSIAYSTSNMDRIKHCVSASEMTYILSGGALNSTHSLCYLLLCVTAVFLVTFCFAILFLYLKGILIRLFLIIIEVLLSVFDRLIYVHVLILLRYSDIGITISCDLQFGFKAK